jgi:uncharacterized membrane protein
MLMLIVVIDTTSCRIANSISSFHDRLVFIVTRGRLRVGRSVLSTSFTSLVIHLATEWRAASLFRCRHTPVRHMASSQVLFSMFYLLPGLLSDCYELL